MIRDVPILSVWPYELFERDWLKAHPENYGLGTTWELCQQFAEYLPTKLDCLAATIWSVDPTRHRLLRIASSGVGRGDLAPESVDAGGSLSGLALDTRQVQFFDSLSSDST